MRIVVSALVLALCVVALPAFAETPEAGCPTASAVSLAGLNGAQDPLPAPPFLLPYCWDVDNTTCTTSIGATKGCQDGIYYDYVCTCKYNSYTRQRYWDCPTVR